MIHATADASTSTLLARIPAPTSAPQTSLLRYFKTGPGPPDTAPQQLQPHPQPSCAQRRRHNPGSRTQCRPLPAVAPLPRRSADTPVRSHVIALRLADRMHVSCWIYHNVWTTLKNQMAQGLISELPRKLLSGKRSSCTSPLASIQQTTRVLQHALARYCISVGLAP